MFHLTLAISNNARRIYLLHLLEECVPWWKTTKLEKNAWTNLKKFYISKNRTKLIQEAIQKVTSIPIENLRASKAITDSNNLAFVTTFHPNKKKFFALIQTAFKPLQQSYETKAYFKDIKLIKSQRQSSRLKKLLTRAILLK